MGKYRLLGTFFDRVFRNNLNANFDDIDTDIQSQKKRVDDLIVGTPQPSEVVDARGGFPVLRDRLDDVASQMAERPTQTEMNALLGNISEGTPLFAPDVASMTDTTRNYVNTTDGYLYAHNGTSFVSTGVQYQSSGIADNTVFPEKTTFIETSTNYANTNDMMVDYDLDVNSGDSVVVVGVFTSVFFKLLQGQEYRGGGLRRIAFYDINKQFITGQHGVATFTLPENAVYIRFSTETPNIAQINKGSALLAYEPYSKMKLSGEIDIGVPMEISYYNISPKVRPAVSLTFDDGNLTDYTNAFPALLERGMRGVFGVVPGSWVDTGGMASSVQLKEMSDNGMSIISHTHTHPQLTTLTREEAIAQFRNSKNAIESITGRACNTLLVPYNLWNPNLEKWVRPFFDYVRVRYDSIHPYGNAINPYHLRSFAIESNTTLEEAKRIVDLAVESNGWVIFMFHKIMTENATEFHWDLPRFTALLDYIDSLDIDVVDLEEGVNRARAYQNILSENLIVNPEFKITLNGQAKPFVIENEGEIGSVSFANGELIITRSDNSVYITNVRDPFFYLEKGATYEFSCEVEINATSYGTGTSGVRISEQITKSYSPIIKSNGIHTLKTTFSTISNEARPDFQVIRGAGIFKFRNPVLRRIK